MASRLLAADLRPLRPYDLKHTGVALLAGHSSVAFIYDRYGHLFPEIDNQAAQRLEGGRSAASSGGNG
jgi:integrase